MSTLLLRLAGPLQSWGGGSRFARRATEAAPTKSGVVGLLAAARGLRRTDPLEDLLTLRFGVRVDQPGRIERDFQTARTADGGRAFPLTQRFYLTDAVFLAAVEGDDAFIAALDHAVRHPAFPLYLGRRSCPPVGPVTLGVRGTSLWSALHDEPWQASEWWRRQQAAEVGLEVRVDAEAVPDDVPEAERPHTQAAFHDVPLSFDPMMREYGWRTVQTALVRMPNPDSTRRRGRGHDPLALLGGA